VLESREAWSATFLFMEDTVLALALTAFVVGAFVSLATSWLLVTRLERLGERFGFSEALLGVVAALAADAPEITSSIAAMTQHQRDIGAGVVIGSNVFNLAALLGLGAVVSGFIAFHRRVVLLGGVVGLWVAVWCILASTGLISVLVCLVFASVVLVSYFIVLGLHRDILERLPLPRRFTSWLSLAIDEEEGELEESIRPSRGRPFDAIVAMGALVVVILSSIAMERGATSLGQQFHISVAIVGGVVLAAVTSLPNAVAAVYLTTKGRGAAALSTSLTSNNLNVVAGLLIPGALVGLAPPSFAGNFTAASYLVLTALVLVLAFTYRGLSRRSGWVIICGYVAFVSWLVLAT
jgi:cation:H+ antiporter